MAAKLWSMTPVAVAITVVVVWLKYHSKVTFYVIVTIVVRCVVHTVCILARWCDWFARIRKHWRLLNFRQIFLKIQHMLKLSNAISDARTVTYIRQMTS